MAVRGCCGLTGHAAKSCGAALAAIGTCGEVLRASAEGLMLTPASPGSSVFGPKLCEGPQVAARGCCALTGHAAKSWGAVLVAIGTS